MGAVGVRGCEGCSQGDRGGAAVCVIGIPFFQSNSRTGLDWTGRGRRKHQ